MIYLWQRYIFKECFKLFISLLAGFYFLYVAIDFSLHMHELSQNISILKIIQYYLYQFVKRADILLPVALLISTIKVLCRLNLRKELLGFQAGGIRAKKLLQPLFLKPCEL